MPKMCDMNDIPSVVMDEIALEGLDGITTEGLFVRLRRRPEFAICLDDAYKQYIWSVITRMNDVEMFELPEPRKPLVIFNRYDYVDPELGMVLEPEKIPKEIYPHVPVDDKVNGIRGSCAFYKVRINVYNMASLMTLKQVDERWGSKLVLVASQKMRNNALMGSSVDPELEIAIIQYCILERIGRARHLGEVTQGRVSLQITGEDPKALFYHRKFLSKNGLIVKQIHHQKSGSQNCSGSLLHLPRFYVERWPKVLFLTKRVIEILRNCKNYIADYEEIKKKLGQTSSLKKLMQTSYFQRFVRTDLRLPYRHLYPDAKECEWRSLNNHKEKMIRVVQLLDPNADVESVFARDDEYDLDDDDRGDGPNYQEFNPTINRTFLSEAYKCIEGAGVNGYSQMELVQKMGLPKLSARTVSRNLLKKGVASTFMNDVGRQRVARFRARKWDQQCTRIQNIERDIRHMRAELLSKALGAGHEVPSSTPPSSSSETPTKRRGKKRSASASLDNVQSELSSREGDMSSVSSSPPSKILHTEIISPMDMEVDKEIKGGSVVSSVKVAQLSSLEEFQTKEAMRKFSKYQNKDGPVMTYRIFKRINMILEYVKIHKVVDDHSKFLKLINEEEDREGLNMKIDKKSLLRILIRLKEDGHLKLYSCLLTDGVKVKTMVFICDKKVPQDHPAVVSAIEQAKMKLFIVNRESINVSLAGLPESTVSNQKQLHPSKKHKITFVYEKTMGRQYGFCPKFVRMRMLHQFLFYLIYGYEGVLNLDQLLVKPFLESKDIVTEDSLLSELTDVYKLELSWKMFIPPLPPYSGCPEGWSIMCDILLRLPLSLFVGIFNVCYVIPGLNEYLQHPVRRHFLVRQLPVAMRNGLMAFRKYIFSIHEVMQRLCFIGLLQFGPQRLKEKDQVLIYINRRTSLLDTTTSKPGYHQISEAVYPETKYEFKCLQDVEAYWYNLWNTCLNTQLGGRMCVQGKDIVLEQLDTKSQMQAALQPVRPSRAPALDNGSVPGDRRGAAGLDSAIFAHLKRNWNWANLPTKLGEVSPKKIDRRKIRLMNLKAAPVVFTKSAIIIKRSINYLHNGHFSAVRTEKRPHTLPLGAEVLPKKGQRRKNVIRRVEARKSRCSLKPYYDDVDLKALQLMSKLRVDWSTEEDTLLLLCKVASMYLCPNPRQQTIAFTEIRDILHSSLPEAQNKTSRACQRRILYMMKNLATSNNLAMNLEELKQDEDITERFGGHEENARGPRESIEVYEIRIHEKFKMLVYELQGRSDRLVTASSTYFNTIPDEAGDFWKLFDVVEPKTVIKSKGIFQDVKNVVDIHCSVVNTIIHSSLCSATDKTSWAYQLFRVYQQYPDSLLRAAMAKLRQDQMVSLKKSYARHKQRGNYLPLSSSPYQLSISYLQLIQTKYQYGVYHEAYLMLKEIIQWLRKTNGVQCMPAPTATGGAAATLVESLCKEAIFLSVEIPDQVIILDPWISETDETYTRIVQRYKDILQTYRSGRDSTTSALFRSNLSDSQDSKLSENVTQENDGDINSRLDTGEKTPNSEEMQHVSGDGGNKYFQGGEDADNQFQRDDIMKSLSVSLESSENSSLRSPESQLCSDEMRKDHEEVKKYTSVSLNVSEGNVLNLPVKERIISTSHSIMDLDENLGEVRSLINHEERDCNSIESGNPKMPPDTDSSLSPMTDNVLLNSAEKNKQLSSTNKSDDQNVILNQPRSSILEIGGPEISGGNEFDNDLMGPINQELSENKINDTQQVSTEHKSGENLSESKVEKGQLKRWGRLAFELISDNDWDANMNIPEHTVDEPDEHDGTDEDKQHRDYMDIVDSSDDGDGVSSNNQQTIVARAATRIALFMMREDMDDTNQVSTKQHAHDFFVVNSCSVFCNLPSNSGQSSDEAASTFEKIILPLPESRINQVIGAVKSEAIVDLKVPLDEEILKCTPSTFWPTMTGLLHFIETKKNLGATLPQIQVFYGTMEDKKLDLATVLSLFVQQRIVMRTGVTVLRYVHQKHIWPWLAHTFKFVRLEREKVAPIESQIVSCSENSDTCSAMHVEEADNNKNDPEKVHKMDDAVSPMDTSDSTSFSSVINDQKKENSLDASDQDICKKNETCENSEILEKVDETSQAKCLGKRAPLSKTSQVTASPSLGTIVASKDLRRTAQNFSFSEKEDLHVVIRPWIRINGTLNRRVLDRLLGAVLGHAMYQPGQSLYAFGRRFQPGLQPVHTRELVEILQSIGCVKMLVRKQKMKVTLFSKPQPIILVDADGTEDEQEIVVEPEADAICRLAQFIGEKQYNQDFMAVQEQMSSGRGSDGETLKRKRNNHHEIHERKKTCQ